MKASGLVLHHFQVLVSMCRQVALFIEVRLKLVLITEKIVYLLNPPPEKLR